MAKAGKKKTEKASAPTTSAALADATLAFARGDYGKAKILLGAKANDPSLSEGEREEARTMLASTGIERGTLWVGIACVGLLALVIIVTKLLQP